MDPHRWQEIRSTFETIVEMDDAERGTQLTALSDSDPELRAAVELMLAADSEADARLASLDAVFFPESTLGSDPLGLAGQTISHFQVHEPIGAGGMGVVYRADDEHLGRAVALKFLLPSYSLDAGVKARFLREAHLVAALDHPNLCTIYEVGTTDDGRFFLAMALYPGETLKARLIRDGPMPVSEILDIARQITEGLECAHGAGIVHRDLKPGNVMLLPDGTVKILDFGLAKARDQSLSEPGARFGTVSYMSPDQIRGETVDARADLWAVGVVLYEMLTGQKPFGGDEDIAVAHAILHDEPVPVSTHRGEVSAALEDLVLRLLEKDPAKRYATASELLSELAVIDTSVQGAIGSLRKRWRRARRGFPAKRWQLMATSGALLLIAAAFGYAAITRKQGNGLAVAPTSNVPVGLGRVVVAPLENRTGMPSLDVVGVMASDWITEGLQKTGFVQVVPTATALQVARYVASRNAKGESREPMRALAAEAGAATVVGGAYYRQGDRILFRVDVADQGGTRLVRALTDVAAPASDPMRGVEELRNRLMGWLALKYDDRLQGATPEGDQPPTYSAYQTFSEGMTRYVAVDNVQALPLFLHAFELDSSFTVALLYASIASTNLGQWARADSLLQKVNDRRQGLSEYNRAWLDYRRAFVHGNHEAALAAIRLAARQAPGSKATYNHAVEAFLAGHYREALAAIEALPPERGPMRGFAPYSDIYCAILHLVGLYDREYTVAVAARHAYSDRLTKFTPLVRGLIARGRLDSLSITLRAAQGIPTDPVGWDYGHLLNEVAEELRAHGHADSAVVYSEQLRQWLKANDRAPGSKLRLVRTLYSLGRRAEARVQLASLRRLHPANLEYVGLAGLLDIRDGRTSSALAAVDSLVRGRGPYQLGIGSLYRARIAAAMGDRDTAVARLREAFAEGLPHDLVLHRDLDFLPLHGYAPFDELVRGRD